MDSTAVGSMIIGNAVMDDVTVTAPINKLTSAKQPLGRKDKLKLETFKLFHRWDSLMTHSYEVRRCVRKTLLGKSLLKKVQSGLKLASYKNTFSLGVVSPEFDFSIFHFSESYKAEYAYALDNLSCLDSLLGKYRDVQSPAGNCNYVTRLVLKVKDIQLFGKVSCARCRETLPKNYRTFLFKHDIQVAENEVEDVQLE